MQGRIGETEAQRDSALLRLCGESPTRGWGSFGFREARRLRVCVCCFRSLERCLLPRSDGPTMPHRGAGGHLCTEPIPRAEASTVNEGEKGRPQCPRHLSEHPCGRWSRGKLGAHSGPCACRGPPGVCGAVESEASAK